MDDNKKQTEHRCSPIITTMILEPYTEDEKKNAASTTDIVMYACIGFGSLIFLIAIVFIVYKLVIPWYKARKGSIAAPKPPENATELREV